MPRHRKILLVDDHGITREGAALHLRALDPEIQVLHARSPEEARAQVLADAPDLLFLDLRFDDAAEDGEQFLRWLKAQPALAPIPVIVMSGEALDRRAVEALLEQHAAGYLSKGRADGAEVFRLALQNIEAGAVFIHGARPNALGAAAAPAPAVRRDARSLGLKPSLQRVLVRHVRGMPYKSIARELDITEATVKEYISEICRLFKVPNAKALIYEIARAGIALDDS
ncbi:MAG: response regulator transcription factor [Rubrivivax sp.]|nr:response regulator transcription factor [Rubrivivax sp.]